MRAFRHPSPLPPDPAAVRIGSPLPPGPRRPGTAGSPMPPDPVVVAGDIPVA
jgi:hypothetical protein